MRVVSSLLIVYSYDCVAFMVRVYLRLYNPFLCGLFLFSSMYRKHSASFWIFSEGIVPFVAIDSVCPWEEIS